MRIDPETMTSDDSPLTLADVVASPLYLDLMTPKVAVGDGAIDFTLPRLAHDGGPVTLSSFAGDRPVALIFGSYT